MKTDNPKFEALLQKLRKQTITGVAAGGDTGAITMIDLGESFSIFIHCAWRLSRYDKVLGTWNDALNQADDEEEEEDIETAEEKTSAIKKIEGLAIESIEVGDFYDLKIMLGKAYRLDVFCDLYSRDELSDYDENWSFSDIDQNLCYVLTENFKLIETKYNTEVPI
jgi:hypothetical protein